MKKLLLPLLFLFACHIFAGEIIIKTKKDFTKEGLQNYISNNFEYILKDSQLSYFISNRKIFDSKPYNDLLNRKANINALKNIFVVKFSGNVSEEVAAAKLSSDPEFEYVEKMPKRDLLFVPNDPLIQEQYYLENINLFDAWDTFQEGKEILVAIIDTGIEYEHEDLIDQIWTNPGESGLDENGVSKDTNGIDDDGNGYIDDFQGWDFISGTGEDNDPRPGNRHGTHVAGIVAAGIDNSIGVTGVSPNTKLMAVKIGNDNPNIRGVQRGYEAILYAAITGADVINCSWGGAGNSQAEKSTIETAIDLGSIIIAAAGNDNMDAAFYPAAYEGVVSVASTSVFDGKSGFSNYNSSVDISAPGSQIYNTVTENEYSHLSGTSMASPVIAGVAAMAIQTFPDFSPRMIEEQLQATADPRVIDDRYIGKLGTGIVDVEKAINEKNAKNIDLFNYDVKDIDGDDIFESGEELDVTFVLENILNPIDNIQYKFTLDPEIEFSETEPVDYGFFDVNQKILDNAFITLPDSLPLDYLYDLELNVTGEDYQRDFVLSFMVNQSYRNLSSEKIDVTVNSRGNIAYNDYPANNEGIGFKYLGGESLLFEGGMIVSSSSQSISSVVRSANQSVQGSDFIASKLIGKNELLFSESADISYTDNNEKGKAGVKIEKTYILAKEGDLAGSLIIQNEITNITETATDSVYVGYFFDWDIGPSGRNNIAEFWKEEEIGIQYNNADGTFPYVASALISEGDFIFYALDNDGSSTINPGVYDGFTRTEQWRTITGKIDRDKSNETDASMVFSSGPYSLEPGESKEVSFILMVSEEKEDFPKILEKAKTEYEALTVEDNIEENKFKVYPNPISGRIINIELDKKINSKTEIRIIDLDGKIVFANNYKLKSKEFSLEIPQLMKGTYIIEIINIDKIYSKKIALE